MPIGPGHLKAPDADRGDALQRARSALDSQRPHEAQRICEDVLKANPRHAQALHIFGCALLMQGRSQDAIAPLETAARELRDPEVDTLFAIALRQAGRPEDALSRLKRATKRRPPYATAFHELGYLLFSLERYDEAIAALHRGLEIAPMMPELSIQLGYVSLKLRKCADAKLAFARALEISPPPPTRCWAWRGRIRKSGRMCRPPIIFGAFSGASPTTQGPGSISGTVFWNLASAMPAMIASARPRAAMPSTTATR